MNIKDLNLRINCFKHEISAQFSFAQSDQLKLLNKSKCKEYFLFSTGEIAIHDLSSNIYTKCDINANLSYYNKTAKEWKNEDFRFIEGSGCKEFEKEQVFRAKCPAKKIYFAESYVQPSLMLPSLKPIPFLFIRNCNNDIHYPCLSSILGH